jgi:hypothetical protein
MGHVNGSDNKAKGIKKLTECNKYNPSSPPLTLRGGTCIPPLEIKRGRGGVMTPEPLPAGRQARILCPGLVPSNPLILSLLTLNVEPYNVELSLPPTGRRLDPSTPRTPCLPAGRLEPFFML